MMKKKEKFSHQNSQVENEDCVDCHPDDCEEIEANPMEPLMINTCKTLSSSRGIFPRLKKRHEPGPNSVKFKAV
jgi:hypothetical protein